VNNAYFYQERTPVETELAEAKAEIEVLKATIRGKL
jgi:hypothetical protein